MTDISDLHQLSLQYVNNHLTTQNLNSLHVIN